MSRTDSTSKSSGSIGPLRQDTSDFNTLVRELVIDHMPLDWQEPATRKQLVSPFTHLREVAEFGEYFFDPLLILLGLIRSPGPKSVEHNVVVVLLSVR